MEIREAEPRDAGVRHVDTPATIAMLRRAHVSTYFYLVLHASSDWSDLKDEFLPAAAQAGIAVWVYLVPPSECCSKPYEADFVRWAEEIARLSLRHRHLVGFAMDDFASNLTTFTPEYTRAMRDAARRINPGLRFLPVLYHDDYSREFLAAYAAHFDGAIFPYTKSYESAAALDEELERLTRQVQPFGLELILMVYATKMSVAEYPPTAEYVAAALAIGLERMARGEILGVTTYGMPKEFALESCGFARHLNLTIPSETPTNPGDFVSVSQSVELDTAAATYRLRFFEQDSYPQGTAGYHYKQLLVDGQTVWDQDVASDADLVWVERSIDLTSHLQGKSGTTITFRLYEKKGVSNFGIRMSVSGLEATGFTIDDSDFARNTGWSFSGQGPGTALYAERGCDPERQRHIFEAVRALYDR